ncbi:hypothetical protein FTO68_07585 [Methanocalculus taiwanensis]|uniref:ATP-cone domain-containing protein n=1 Tax=Methanocalculus taiwanensis TaxID=106207 RepID=A0ABD4TJH2_9EURY|nr:hypothetical protein [Methanocalculus taiwanensis]MCQ1538846.1 hypothetical protein [Methanocalculus taiwanensis]
MINRRNEQENKEGNQERRFRSTARRVIGERKGDLDEAATDAMKLRIHVKTQEAIATDALELIRKTYRFGEKRYSSRKDLYLRSNTRSFRCR